MRKFLLLVFLLYASPTQAQITSQPPYNAAVNKYFWTAPDNAKTVAVAQALTFTVSIDGGTAATIAGVTCVAKAAPQTGIACDGSMTPAQADALNALPGTHTVVITPSNAGVSGQPSDPFASPASAPAKVTGVGIK